MEDVHQMCYNEAQKLLFVVFRTRILVYKVGFSSLRFLRKIENLNGPEISKLFSLENEVIIRSDKDKAIYILEIKNI